MIQFFHWYYPGDGSLWKKLKEQAPRLSELGFTAVWLPPAYKGTNGGCSIGYDHQFEAASKGGRDFDLSKIFCNTLVAARPELAVTVVGNHDTQSLQSLEAPIEDWFKPLAYALILLRDTGYPCVFYSDLYGSKYIDKGHDGQDHEIHLPVCGHLEKLLQARKRLAYGVQRDYFDDSDCVDGRAKEMPLMRGAAARYC